jgi:hypothetical protein
MEPSLLGFTQPHVDEDGLHWEIVGWYQHKKRKRYLVEYTRPGVYQRCTHALVDSIWMPRNLLQDFQHQSSLDIGLSENQGNSRIRLNNITQVLDMAWYGWGSNRAADSSDLSLWQSDTQSYKSGNDFKDFFIQLQWRDRDGDLKITWEYAQTLMDVMDSDHCISLLARWVNDIDYRHNQLISKCPAKDIQQVLGKPGWQYI